MLVVLFERLIQVLRYLVQQKEHIDGNQERNVNLTVLLGQSYRGLEETSKESVVFLRLFLKNQGLGVTEDVNVREHKESKK